MTLHQMIADMQAQGCDPMQFRRFLASEYGVDLETLDRALAGITIAGLEERDSLSRMYVEARRSEQQPERAEDV